MPYMNNNNSNNNGRNNRNNNNNYQRSSTQRSSYNNIPYQSNNSRNNNNKRNSNNHNHRRGNSPAGPPRDWGRLRPEPLKRGEESWALTFKEKIKNNELEAKVRTILNKISTSTLDKFKQQLIEIFEESYKENSIEAVVETAVSSIFKKASFEKSFQELYSSLISHIMADKNDRNLRNYAKCN
eukprot:UN30799